MPRLLDSNYDLTSFLGTMMLCPSDGLLRKTGLRFREHHMGDMYFLRWEIAWFDGLEGVMN